MSELFDKEVNAQKESLKNLWGSCKLPQAHEKVCNANETTKNNAHVKFNVIDGRKHFIGRIRKTIWTSFGSIILDTMKIPFV